MQDEKASATNTNRRPKELQTDLFLGGLDTLGGTTNADGISDTGFGGGVVVRIPGLGEIDANAVVVLEPLNVDTLLSDEDSLIQVGGHGNGDADFVSLEKMHRPESQRRRIQRKNDYEQLTILSDCPVILFFASSTFSFRPLITTWLLAPLRPLGSVPGSPKSIRTPSSSRSLEMDAPPLPTICTAQYCQLVRQAIGILEGSLT